MPPSSFRWWFSLLLVAALTGAASADLRKLDPRARAALASLEAGQDATARLERRMATNTQGELDVFIRGSASRAELEAAGARVRTMLPGLCTAYLPLGAVERVAALPGVERIRGAAPMELELNASVPATGVTALRGAGPNFSGPNGSGVLIGDVDTGVDYGHGDFDDPSGNTRLIRIWDQDGSGSAAPDSFNYGAEWTSAQINADLCTERDTDGHGTHVMGIAGGDGSQTGNGVPAYTYAGMAPKADLVMVKTNFLDSGVLDGVKYCFDLAETRSQNAVVNLSLGTHFGPHDGTSDFEQGLNELTGPGRIIVKSAGNDRGSTRHAEVLAAGAGTVATMSISGSAVGGLVVIDGYYESTENLQVQLTTPNGTIIGPISRGVINASYPGLSTANGTVYLENGASVTSGGDFEIYLEINVNTGQSMNGTWTFTFIPVALGAALGEVDLWRFFNTGGVSASFVIGVQSTEELLTEPGNADSLITVAAFGTRQQWTDCNGAGVQFGTPVGSIATFSSPGPTRDGRQKPDLAAPGTAIGSAITLDITQVCPSPPTLSTRLPDGLNHIMNQGTSMAAPHVSGAVALILQSHGALMPFQVKEYLFAHANTSGIPTVWNKDWGNGKLFLDSSVGTLISLFLANPVDGGIELRWRLGEPGRFARIETERASSAAGPWQILSSEPRRDGDLTVVLDGAVERGQTYFYRLSAFLRDGSTMTFGPISVTAGSALERLELAAVRPNPARNLARIDFALPRAGVIRLALHDVQGREVAVLAEGLHAAGRYQATWGGAGAGGTLGSGIYFLRLSTPAGERVQRFAVAR